MTGDVGGVREAYLETAEALRQRLFSAPDVAARVRLSKTPEAYLSARSGHSEQAYEALLAAGRAKWTPGERVRFYRSLSGLSVWVPDESEEIIIGDDQEAEAKEHGRKPHEALLPLHPGDVKSRRDYDLEHYLRVLVTSYASRLRKAYATEDFEQLFRPDEQLGLFDRPVEQIQPIGIRCQTRGN
jgi:DNA polymerase, archaea type